MGLPTIPGETAPTSDEHRRTPPETRGAQYVLAPTPPLPSSSCAQITSLAPHKPSDQDLDVTENLSGRPPTPDGGNDAASPTRLGSTTPTQRDQHNTSVPLASPTSPSIGRQDGWTGQSRHGKGRRIEPYSDEEIGSNGGDIPMGDASNSIPRQQHYGEVQFVSGICFPILMPQQSRPATENDILKLCQSFHDLTREIVREIVTELRKANGRSGNSANYAADDESDHDVPRRRMKKPKAKYPGVRRRPPAQNALSVFLPGFLFLSLTSPP